MELAGKSLVTTATGADDGTVVDRAARHYGVVPHVAVDRDQAPGIMAARLPGSTPWFSVVNVVPCLIGVPSPMVIPPLSWKRSPC